MKAGYGYADITPQRPMPLCGFASRCEAPFVGIDDPLNVRALAVESDGRTVVVLVYDLLALGREIHTELRAALREVNAPDGSAPEWVLCATHTHSAPAAIELLGCGEAQRDYWDTLLQATRAAAASALRNMRPASIRTTTAQVPDRSYNRRRVLADGRVVMTAEPDAPVLKAGPILERVLLLRFDDHDGKGIAGIATWAAHPIMVCSPNVTADFPGELCRRLSAQHGFPFLYFQGACGNLNPVFTELTRAQMLRNVAAIMARLAPCHWPAAEPAPACGFVRRSVALSYAPLASEAELCRMEQHLATIANRGDGPPETMRILADILNVKPGAPLDPVMARHIAAILQRWCAATRAAAANGRVKPVELAAAVWRLGRQAFCFVAAEAFVETAFRLQSFFPDDEATLVCYAGPLVGYLPTDTALDEGGYETAYAYRFYNHPAPFAKGSENRLVIALTTMIRACAKPLATVQSVSRLARGFFWRAAGVAR